MHYKYPLLAGVLPRLANSAFTYAQPFLIDTALSLTSENTSTDSATRNYGYGLIAAYAIVYVGIGVCQFYLLQHVPCPLACSRPTCMMGHLVSRNGLNR